MRNLFCSQQDNYKILIRSTYDDYVNVYKMIKQKHPIIQPGLMTVEEHNALTEEAARDLRVASKKQARLMKEMVELMYIYCAKYPYEEICKYPHWKTYDEYPYRLNQNLTDFINKL